MFFKRSSEVFVTFPNESVWRVDAPVRLANRTDPTTVKFAVGVEVPIPTLALSSTVNVGLLLAFVIWTLVDVDVVPVPVTDRRYAGVDEPIPKVPLSKDVTKGALRELVIRNVGLVPVPMPVTAKRDERVVLPMPTLPELSMNRRVVPLLWKFIFLFDAVPSVEMMRPFVVL